MCLLCVQLAIAKNNIIKLQEENQQLRGENSLILIKAQQHFEVRSRSMKWNRDLSDYSPACFHQKLDRVTCRVPVFNPGDPRRRVSGEGHIQTVAPGFG